MTPTILRADFAYAAAVYASLPAPAMAEIAFAGRSNVGKSY
jgi:GTP-binding protein